MQRNYRGAVFFDLDGTLLNAESQVDETVANAVHQLEENNYLPVICTGRSPIEIEAATSATGIDTYVTLNGAFVQSQDKIIYHNDIKPELIKDIMGKAHKSGDALFMHTPDRTFLSGKTPFIKEFFQKLRLDIPEIDPDFYQKDDIQMFVILTDSDGSSYQEQYPELQFYNTGYHSLDTVAKGVSKMSGIKEVLKAFDLTDKPVYAFGDGTNDLPMIQFADYSVAMGNGIDAVKEAATYITTENVNGGIVNGLKHFNLI
ncbi:Cof-type HAD-IIB family hydrolase [Companilactobacillus huachuanensis]|uniref:Cof-type HAD-IIB family hydrolase n=1 Tax=Companilactobacillus huachuanensis TaxID=2559914 RepID=A0ABW1RPK2_9LACO|nr:Cof-type HAD-IIB family hydrolase [Companilactobacillus huachuanensis]